MDESDEARIDALELQVRQLKATSSAYLVALLGLVRVHPNRELIELQLGLSAEMVLNGSLVEDHGLTSEQRSIAADVLDRLRPSGGSTSHG